MLFLEGGVERGKGERGGERVSPFCWEKG